MEIEELKEAAKDLNNVCGLEPAIDTGPEATMDSLLENIKEAARLLVEGDPISEKTRIVISDIEHEVDTSISKPTNEGEGGTLQETGKRKAKKNVKKEDTSKPIPRPKKEEVVIRYTRTDSFVDAIKDGKARTIDEIAEKMQDLFNRRNNYTSTVKKESLAWAANTYCRVLVGLGLMSYEKERGKKGKFQMLVGINNTQK